MYGFIKILFCINFFGVLGNDVGINREIFFDFVMLLGVGCVLGLLF